MVRHDEMSWWIRSYRKTIISSPKPTMVYLPRLIHLVKMVATQLVVMANRLSQHQVDLPLVAPAITVARAVEMPLAVVQIARAAPAQRMGRTLKVAPAEAAQVVAPAVAPAMEAPAVEVPVVALAVTLAVVQVVEVHQEVAPVEALPVAAPAEAALLVEDLLAAVQLAEVPVISAT